MWMFLMLFHMCFYPKTMLVTETDTARDVVVCTDYNGNEWEFEGIEDWEAGDIVSAIMWDHETETIHDDEIVMARYGGGKLTMRIHKEAAAKREDNITFEVKEEIGVVGDRGKGGVVRLDYAAWNGNAPKYELRIWKEKDGTLAPTKGIGLTGEELETLGDMIDALRKGD